MEVVCSKQLSSVVHRHRGSCTSCANHLEDVKTPTYNTCRPRTTLRRLKPGQVSRQCAPLQCTRTHAPNLRLDYHEGFAGGGGPRCLEGNGCRRPASGGWFFRRPICERARLLHARGFRDPQELRSGIRKTRPSIPPARAQRPVDCLPGSFRPDS